MSYRVISTSGGGDGGRGREGQKVGRGTEGGKRDRRGEGGRGTERGKEEEREKEIGKGAGEEERRSCR